MKKICLCIFGVIPRSIKYTFKSIEENIINELKINNFDVEIYVFNLNIDDKKIDNTYVDQNDISLIPYNYLEEEYQTTIDNELDILKLNKNISFTRTDYGPETVKNCLRQMYSEYRVGLFLEKNINKYDLAIICGPDFYIANKLDINEILNSYNNSNFYTTISNDAQGYTNGFYFGKPEILIKPLKRLSFIQLFMPAHRDYEYILKQSIDNNNIVRNVSSLMFFKIRANKDIFFRNNSNIYTRMFSKERFNVILNEYNELVKKLNDLKNYEYLINGKYSRQL
jgi:hypothetical protein